jgi:hypothetical protein
MRSTSTSVPAEMSPGEVVIANLLNAIEDRQASGKERPVIIVKAPKDGCLTVIGLTSKGVTRRGERRLPIATCGGGWLRGASFVFSSRPVRISRHDIYEHLGWIDEETQKMMTDKLGIAFDEARDSEYKVAS